MAPALSSNSFRLVLAGIHSKPESKPPPKVTCTSSIIVSAKQNPSAEGPTTKPSNPFFVDLGKFPDPKSLIPGVLVTSPASTSLFAPRRRKDPNTVFVAGATGQAGVRITQTLLRQGFAVRAGVPDLSSAQEIARVVSTYKIISPEETRRLNAVESSFEEAEAIAEAIGRATKVVVTVGPAEKGPAAEMTAEEALRVVRGAQLAGVGHVAVVYDAGGGLSGVGGPSSSTYNVLDGITSFFANVFAREQPLTLGEFLAKVAEMEVSYTLIKARLTEDYAAESSHGLVVAKEGTNAGVPAEAKVSRSQIATLVADVFSNISVAENKVVEVSTSPSATPKPVAELFSAIPEDGRRKAYQEALAKARAEEEAIIASERAREAAVVAKKLEEEVKKLSEQEAQAASLAEEARERAAAAGSTPENLLSRAKRIGGGFSWENLSSQITSAVSQVADDQAKTQIATIRGQAKALRLPPQKAVIKQSTQKQTPQKTKPTQSDPKPAVRNEKPTQSDPKPAVRNVFGGLFKQETIYVDDD